MSKTSQRKLIIFGASGDLTKKKILKSLNNLKIDNLCIILYCRTCTELSFKEYIQEHSQFLHNIIDKIVFIKGSYDDISSLEKFIDEQTVFYLSIPPEIHINVLNQINKINKGIVAIEKPYGKTQLDFQILKQGIKQLENVKVFFVDHFLAKKVASELKNIFSTNSFFRKFLNSNFVEYCEIKAKETITAEKRKYFDQSGIFNDMILNHLMEYFCLTASDYSIEDCEERYENLLSNTKNLENLSFSGQYSSYKEEFGYPSTTDTFCLKTLEVRNKNWDTPFFIYSGKGLKEKNVEIAFKFKQEKLEEICSFLQIPSENVEQISLGINIQPEQKIYIVVQKNQRKYFDVIYDDAYFNKKSTHFDYEKVLYSLLMGESFEHASVLEVDYFYKIYENHKKNNKLVEYQTGASLDKEIELIKSLYFNNR